MIQNIIIIKKDKNKHLSLEKENYHEKYFQHHRQKVMLVHHATLKK